MTSQSSPGSQHARPPVGQEQIIYMAAKLLDSLEEAEDQLWEADEDEVAKLIGRTLQAVATMLDEVREKLPRTEEERVAIARGLVACHDRAVLGAGTADRSRPSPCVGNSPPHRDSPPRHTDELSASMERARENILIELRTAGAGISREEAMVEQLRIMEAALDDIREAITEVDAEDLRQAWPVIEKWKLDGRIQGYELVESVATKGRN